MIARPVDVGNDCMRPDQLKTIDGHVAVTVGGDMWLLRLE